MSTELIQKDREIINNTYYDSLGSDWTCGNHGPLVVLRAEGALKNQWVADTLRAQLPKGSAVLDIGCGGGILTSLLAQQDLAVTGLDASEPSLAHARSQDPQRKIHYLMGDAMALPLADKSFDAVTCFDLLEHVSQPAKVVAEAARVLKPGGLFFYHTFSRNPVAHLVAIKGLEWFVEGTPEKLHVIELFIKPGELRRMVADSGLNLLEERGIRPRLGRAFWKMIFTKKVDPDFSFTWTSSKMVSYAGLAKKPM